MRRTSIALELSLLLPAALASSVCAQENRPLPDAPHTTYVVTAQTQVPQLPVAGPSPDKPAVQSITLEQALDLAKRNNPTLKANQYLVLQNRAQEITANLRPNPTFSADSQYLPFFSPDLATNSNYWENAVQWDAGVGYLFERGGKRQHRLDAARTATAVTEAQVADMERVVMANVAQAFVAALLARSNLQSAHQVLDSYKQTVDLSTERHNAGAMSRNDLLKIQLQQLQFENDVSAARIALVQSLANLRQLVGFDSVAPNYEVVGQLAYEPLKTGLTDLQARALSGRPDLQAAHRGVAAAQSQIGLAKANGKMDFNMNFDYTRLGQQNLAAVYFNVPLPVFNRNQGEIARTQYAETQSEFLQQAAEQQVLTDVRNSYEAVLSNEQLVKLYDQGYLDKSAQALDISKFSYEQGAASLLDFLDAERSYRATQLSYRQSLAAYMVALEELKQAVGTRDLQ